MNSKRIRGARKLKGFSPMRLLFGALALVSLIFIVAGHANLSRLRYEADSTDGQKKYYVGALRDWKPASTDGPKYLVGCDVNNWKLYVRPEWYYVFSELIKVYGWKEYPISMISIDQSVRERLINEKPLVILFCEAAVEMYPYLPIDELRQQGTNIAAFSDDSHKYNQFSTSMLRYILDHTDTMVGTYAYLMENYFSSVPLHKPPPNLIWLPHSASPTFTERLYNNDPIRKIFLSGASQADAYPIRHWLHDTFQKEHQAVMSVYEHPGYLEHAENQSAIYAQTARSYFAAITTTMVHRRLVAKVFELPAVGSLLIVNLDLEQYMEALGMENMKHYVGFKDDDPEAGIWWAMDPKNIEKIESIRRNGMELMRTKHTTSNRAAALDDFFQTGKVPYPFPKINRSYPCPMKGFDTTVKCIDYFKRYIHHHRPEGAVKSLPSVRSYAYTHMRNV
jgi:hypothetical protein